MWLLLMTTRTHTAVLQVLELELEGGPSSPTTLSFPGVAADDGDGSESDLFVLSHHSCSTPHSGRSEELVLGEDDPVSA